MKGKIRTEKGNLVDVNVDGERYSQSIHGGFDCIACHKQFGINPHKPAAMGDVPKDIAVLASKISHKAKVDPVALAACSECHGDIYKSWQNSIHGSNVINKKQTDGASCIDCHGSPHYITSKKTGTSTINKRMLSRLAASATKRKNWRKNIIFGTHILERYYESFHGKNIYWGIKMHLSAQTAIAITM